MGRLGSPPRRAPLAGVGGPPSAARKPEGRGEDGRARAAAEGGELGKEEPERRGRCVRGAGDSSPSSSGDRRRGALGSSLAHGAPAGAGSGGAGGGRRAARPPGRRPLRPPRPPRARRRESSGRGAAGAVRADLSDGRRAAPARSRPGGPALGLCASSCVTNILWRFETELNLSPGFVCDLGGRRTPGVFRWP